MGVPCMCRLLYSMPSAPFLFVPLCLPFFRRRGDAVGVLWLSWPCLLACQSCFDVRVVMGSGEGRWSKVVEVIDKSGDGVDVGVTLMKSH